MSQIYSVVRGIHFKTFAAFHRRYLSSVAPEVSLPAHSRQATDAGKDPDAFLLAAHLDTVRRDANYTMLQASKSVTWAMVSAGLFGAYFLISQFGGGVSWWSAVVTGIGLFIFVGASNAGIQKQDKGGGPKGTLRPEKPNPQEEILRKQKDSENRSAAKAADDKARGAAKKG